MKNTLRSLYQIVIKESKPDYFLNHPGLALFHSFFLDVTGQLPRMWLSWATFSFIPTLCFLSNCDQGIWSLAIFSIIQSLLYFTLYFFNFYSLFLDSPTPKNVTALRELNRICILYRKFVKGFGSIMAHLTDFTNEDQFKSVDTAKGLPSYLCKM